MRSTCNVARGSGVPEDCAARALAGLGVVAGLCRQGPRDELERARAMSVHARWLAGSAVEVMMHVCPRKQMRNGLKLINFVKNGSVLDDAPWTWGQTGGWTADMPDFFKVTPGGVRI